MAATALLRLGKLLGRSDYLDAAENTLAAAVPIMERAPMAAGQMLLALDRYLGPAHELVLVGDFARDDTKAALAAIHRRYLPRSVLAARDSKPTIRRRSVRRHLDELFAGKTSPDGQPVLYVCQNFACQAAGRWPRGNRIAARRDFVGGCLHSRRRSTPTAGASTRHDDRNAACAAAITSASGMPCCIAIRWHASYSGVKRREPSGRKATLPAIGPHGVSTFARFACQDGSHHRRAPHAERRRLGEKNCLPAGRRRPAALAR